MINIILIGILGATFGSFVNALVWRIHQQSSTRSKKKLRELSVLYGRSMCPHCRHTLAPRDLVPVLSWVALKGKCRYCHAPISATYPIVELVTGFLFSLTFVFFRNDHPPMASLAWLLLAIWLGCIVVMVALAVYDFRWMLLPNRLVGMLLGLAVLYAVVLAVNSGSSMVLLNSVLAGMLFFGLFYALFSISDGKWLGGGDVKLALPLGILVGSYLGLFLVLYIASITGLLYALLFSLKQGKFSRKLRIPFGPFLLFATYVVVNFSSVIDGVVEQLLYSGV